MRVLQFVLILGTVLVLGGMGIFRAVSPAWAHVWVASRATTGSMPSAATMLADAVAATTQGSDGEDLQYLPKEAVGGDDKGASVGTFLIIAAAVVFGVIVGFVIRYHRSGDAG